MHFVFGFAADAKFCAMLTDSEDGELLEQSPIPAAHRQSAGDAVLGFLGLRRTYGWRRSAMPSLLRRCGCCCCTRSATRSG